MHLRASSHDANRRRRGKERRILIPEQRLREDGGVLHLTACHRADVPLVSLPASPRCPARLTKILRRTLCAPDERARNGPIRLDANLERIVGQRKRPPRARKCPAHRRVSMHRAQSSDDARSVAQTVPLIRHINGVLRLRQLRPVKLQRIERPVAVIRAQHDELRLREPGSVTEWIDHRQELSTALAPEPRRDLERRVVLDLIRQLPPRRALQIHLRTHIEHIDHHRCDGHDARIDRGGEPGRPTALRGARHRELRQRDVPALARNALHRIHRPHGALDHRQQHGPIALTGPQVLIERIGDERIFPALEDRLEWHLPEHTDGRADRLRQPCEVRCFARQLRRAKFRLVFRLPTSAVQEQQRAAHIRFHPRRTQQIELMLPLDAAPRLRGQPEFGVLDLADATGCDLAPTKTLILLRRIGFELAIRDRLICAGIAERREHHERRRDECSPKRAGCKCVHDRSPAERVTRS